MTAANSRASENRMNARSLHGEQPYRINREKTWRNPQFHQHLRVYCVAENGILTRIRIFLAIPCSSATSPFDLIDGWPNILRTTTCRTWELRCDTCGCTRVKVSLLVAVPVSARLVLPWLQLESVWATIRISRGSIAVASYGPAGMFLFLLLLVSQSGVCV